MKTDRWFVRLPDGSARGPLTHNEIVNKLLGAELMVQDCISRDGVAWIPIADEKSIEESLRSMLETKKKLPVADEVAAKKQEEKKEAPKDDNGEVTLSNIDILVQGINNQLEEAENLSRNVFESSTIRKILTDINVNKTRAVVVKIGEENQKYRSNEINYVMANAPPPRKPPVDWKIWIGRFVKLTVLFLFMFGAYFAYNYHKEKMVAESAKLTKEAVRRGLEAKALGEYQKALMAFRGITNESHLEAEELIEMAEVNHREGKYEEAAKYAQKALSNTVNEIQESRANLLLGMIETEKNNTENAKNYFQKALKAKADYVPALFNLGLIHLSANRFQEAEQTFLKALQHSGPVAPLILALSETAMTIDGQNKTVERVFQVEALFDEYKKRYDDYRYEISLAKLRMAAFKRDPKQIEERLADFIGQNAEIHQRQMRDFQLNHARLDSRSLYSWCMEIYSKVPRTPQLNAMISLCLYRSGDVNEALKFAHVASEAAPKDPQISGLYSLLLSITGQNEKASMVLDNAKKNGNSKYEFMTRAKTCERMGNWTCAVEYWKKLRAIDPGEPSALEGLIKAFYQQGDMNEVRPLLREGMARYPNLQTYKKIAMEMLAKGQNP